MSETGPRRTVASRPVWQGHDVRPSCSWAWTTAMIFGLRLTHNGGGGAAVKPVRALVSHASPSVPLCCS